MFMFISYSCLINTSIHFAFPILFLFHAYYIWHFIDLYRNTYTCTYPYHRHILIHCDAYVFRASFIYSCSSTNQLYSEIGIIPIESSKLKLWHFYAKLVNLPILPEGQLAILIFQCLDSVFDTGSLYPFKAKVLRVLLQLELSKSEHRNSL